MLSEVLNPFHFAYPSLLWGLLVIPLVWLLYFFFYQKHSPAHQLEKFIDSHLLPYLIVNPEDKKRSFLKILLLWSSVWLCLILALAGPRWSFREMETYSRDQSLVILLDLSESMNATDLKPTRLIRAKQKIEDLINLSKGVKIGLIAFAADPHMITPITDDKETIRHLLPSLGTDLVYVQGSRLSTALEMAATMLGTEPGNNKAILVISDGGFEDASAISTAKKLADNGLTIYAMGVGTTEGAPLLDKNGHILKKNGSPILSKLEKGKLEEISKAGHGIYLEAHHHLHDEKTLLGELEKRADAQMEIGKTSRHWDEHFYLLIFPALPILLWWFRRGYLLAILLLLVNPVKMEAAGAADYFKNSEQLGQQAFDEQDYKTAVEIFQDPYRRGVACYRAGDFAEAEKMFRQSSREEVASDAAYNLGNALVQQQKLKEAKVAYQDVLKKWPDHTKAKENLELVKKMMEDQKKNNSDQKNQDKNEKQDKQDSDSSDKDDQQQQQKDDQEQNQDQSLEDQKEQNGSEEDQKNDDQSEKQQEELNEPEETEKKEQPAKASRSEEDQDADLWLNQVGNEPKQFLKNKFYLESKKNGTIQGTDPW